MAMIKPKIDPTCYSDASIDGLMSCCLAKLPKLLADFSQRSRRSKGLLQRRLQAFQTEAPRYQRLIDTVCHEEFADNPGGVKPFVVENCPIIRRALNSEDEDLALFRDRWKTKSPEQLLDSLRWFAEFHAKLRAQPPTKQQAADPGYWDEIPTLGLEGLIGPGISLAILHAVCPDFCAPRDAAVLHGWDFISQGHPLWSRAFSLPGKNHASGGAAFAHNHHFPADLFQAIMHRLSGVCEGLTEAFADRSDRFTELAAFLADVAEHEPNKELWKRDKYSF